jgi:hypothetical protein
MQLVTVFRAFSPGEAQLVRSRLEAAGFLTQVQHELSSLNMEGYSLSTGGIRVQVPADQADEALGLLASVEGGPE